jgi:hypothetical protein
MGCMDAAAVLAPYRDLSSNYGEKNFPLSDHLPMAVSALFAMGASGSRVSAWAEAHARRRHLRPAEANERAGRDRWSKRIARDGVRETLLGAIDTLGDGIGAAAFHAVIRAGYALDRSDDAELAAALESWEREFLALPIPDHVQQVPVTEALAALARSRVADSGGGLIASAMQAVSRRKGFDEIAAAVPPAADLDTIALAAAAAFAQSGNFTALHVMTGTYALLRFRAHLGDVEPIMPSFWRAFAAAAIVAGALPTLDPEVLAKLRNDAPPDWAPLLAEAIDHEDEHVIKATYTAWRLDAERPDPVYRAAAAGYIRKLRAVKDPVGH